jgi:hypothetical protein
LLADRGASGGGADRDEDDKREAIAAVFGAFGRQVGDKAAGTGSTEAFSVEK